LATFLSREKLEN